MIELKFEGDLWFQVTEDDGSVNNVQVPDALVTEMLESWMNQFFETALAQAEQNGSTSE